MWLKYAYLIMQVSQIYEINEKESILICFAKER